MKVAINKRSGGFELSNEALIFLAETNSPILEKEPLDDWEDDLVMHDSGYLVGRYIFGVVAKDGVVYSFDRYDNALRAHPDLISVIMELRDDASSPYADIKVIDIPDDVDWQIAYGDYGNEWVAETHRIWG